MKKHIITIAFLFVAVILLLKVPSAFFMTVPKKAKEITIYKSLGPVPIASINTNTAWEWIDKAERMVGLISGIAGLYRIVWRKKTKGEK